MNNKLLTRSKGNKIDSTEMKTFEACVWKIRSEYELKL